MAYPEQTVDEAFAAFHRWCDEHADKLEDLDPLEKIEAYYRWYSKLQ